MPDRWRSLNLRKGHITITKQSQRIARMITCFFHQIPNRKLKTPSEISRVLPIEFHLICQVNNFFIFPGMSFGAMCLGFGNDEGWSLDVLNSQDIPTTKQLTKNGTKWEVIPLQNSQTFLLPALPSHQFSARSPWE